MMFSLFRKKCIPCEGGIPPLTPDEVNKFLGQLATPWTVIDNEIIRRDFDFDDYSQVLRFVKKVGKTSIREDHHPIMHVYFQKVTLEFWTHAIKGLSENDFIMAAKSEKIYHKINRHSTDQV